MVIRWRLGKQNVISGDEQFWLCCWGILVGWFRLFKMLSEWSCVIIWEPRWSSCWGEYQVGWWALKSPPRIRFLILLRGVSAGRVVGS